MFYISPYYEDYLQSKNDLTEEKNCAHFKLYSVLKVADGEDADIGLGRILQSEETVEAISDQFSLAWSSFKHIFTPKVFKGLLGK